MTPRRTDAASTAPPARIPAAAPVALPLVTLHADGIVQIDYSPCDRITFATAQYANARHRELSPGRKTPVLLTGGRVGNVEYRAQRHASSPEVCDVTAAVAVVTRSFLERHLAKMFLMYHRPPYPTRVFSAEPEARAWLRGFLPPSK
ncbi:MAG TPA: STAS/SEC14 domain-containing protein [Acidiferrobacterales bacterium]|nr:STAS/SEC14 domain-containing protein [Acidiferrobacterales bacterium]